jgi:putative phosphoribosyl transferase
MPAAGESNPGAPGHAGVGPRTAVDRSSATAAAPASVETRNSGAGFYGMRSAGERTSSRVDVGNDSGVRFPGSERSPFYADRRDAGGALADSLAGQELSDGVVVGLARGGVVVAAEVVRRLGLPLDALAVRKVRHPLQPEYAIGAVTPGGGLFLRADVGDLTDHELRAAVASARSGAEDLDRHLHARRAPISVVGRPCVLVDDGLATGATMVAAARWARGAGAARVIVGVPVGSRETVGILRREADAVVCVETPTPMYAVGEWYADFRQVSDEEVIALMAGSSATSPVERPVGIPADGVELAGDLALPAEARGIVLFAHGSGSSRLSPRNRSVARRLGEAGIGTLLLDLLTPEEAPDRDRVFDIPLLAARLRAARAWVGADPDARDLAAGYFGASTGAAAALRAAADEPSVRAIVSRGGRPDLAGSRLADVRAPTLLIVGGNDEVVLELNREAAAELRCPHELSVIPGATHLFEEAGALERVADEAAAWFRLHLPGHE